VIIDVQGSGKRVRAQVEDFATYCALRLCPRMAALCVTVELVPNLLEKEGIYGECFPEDITDFSKPREFVIRADSRVHPRKRLITIAHEMVHVKQYAKGELYQSRLTQLHRWHGKWITEEIEYWDLPWEIEAHGREEGLFVRWAQDRKLTGQSWTHEP